MRSNRNGDVIKKSGGLKNSARFEIRLETHFYIKIKGLRIFPKPLFLLMVVPTGLEPVLPT
jgi:hypothetical protein